MARRFGAILDVITVVPGYEEILMEFTHADGRQADEAVARIGRVHLENTLRHLDLSDLEVRAAIRVGAPAIELAIDAESIKPDLLVVSGNGHVAQHVIVHAGCPVAVLPQ
jgi:hypothetical protein